MSKVRLRGCKVDQARSCDPQKELRLAEDSGGLRNLPSQYMGTGPML